MPYDDPKLANGGLVYRLIAEADLSFWFVQGQGLGAVLLALILIILIRSPSMKRTNLLHLVQAFRAAKAPTDQQTRSDTYRESDP